jgi:acyl dehydratase
MRYWEDLEVGETAEVGPVTVTEADIVEFASKYDPQPFHLDAEAASKTMYGGLIASGWHTSALYMGMYVRGVLSDTASLGAPGVEIRWTMPVRPGDSLTGRAVVTELQPSSSDPRRGTVYVEHEVRNQDGDVVMTLRSRGMIARRPSST